MLEEKFATIFSLLERFRIKTNLIHNSAVNLSLCVDNSWHIDEAIEALREAGFDVMKAENMELLTVRGYTDEVWRKYARGPQVFVRQATQSTVRVVRKRESPVPRAGFMGGSRRMRFERVRVPAPLFSVIAVRCGVCG